MASSIWDDIYGGVKKTAQNNPYDLTKLNTPIGGPINPTPPKYGGSANNPAAAVPIFNGSPTYNQDTPTATDRTNMMNTPQTQDQFADDIRAAYADVGRTVSDAEIDSHRGNPGGVAAVREMLGRGAGGNDSTRPGDVGHDGSWQGQSREQWRDAWMSAGQMTPAQADAWMASHGAVKISNNGTYRTPYGEVLDLGIGYRSGTVTPGFTNTGGSGGGSGAGGSDGSGGSGGTGAAGAGHPSGWDDLYNTLLGRAQQSTDISRSDPAVRAQADAYAANTDRSRQDFLQSQAERGDPYGAGYQGGQERITAEHAGQANAGFEAELMGRELTARRDQIQNALTQMGGMLSQEQTIALQRELARMNDALQRRGQDLNQNQFDATLGFNVDDRSSYWDAIRTGLLG